MTDARTGRRGGALVALVVLVAGCVAAAEPGVEMLEMPLEEFRDRLRGGWAGQVIGVSYGAPYEFRSLGKPITGPLRPWRPQRVQNSLQQDDLYVEATFLEVLERHGPEATSAQAAAAFKDTTYRLWHANRAARENLRQGIGPPESGQPRHNLHSDDIDFQIEADIFGLVAPGLPASASRMSEAFGRVMNHGDGLYGGLFVASMYSQAYRETEATPAAIRRCVEAGVAAIHPESSYAAVIREVLAAHARHPEDWMHAWTSVQEKWGEDDRCPQGRDRPLNIDAKLNGAYAAIGLLYGAGDFSRTLEIATRCGQDADCNPASAAGVLGTILGFARIPAPYTAAIPQLAGRSFEGSDRDLPGLVAGSEKVALQVIARSGGRVLIRDGVEILSVPVQEPRAAATLEQMRLFSDAQLRTWEAEGKQRRKSAFLGRFDMQSWSPGWRILACGDVIEPVLRELHGRQRVLPTHPVSRTEPAVLETVIEVPSSPRPALRLTVSSHPERRDADWRLRVVVDGDPVHESIVNAPGRWQEVEVDLSPYRGRTVTVRLENAAGGRLPWAWEVAYWAPVEVVPSPRP